VLMVGDGLMIRLPWRLAHASVAPSRRWCVSAMRLMWCVARGLGTSSPLLIVNPRAL